MSQVPRSMPVRPLATLIVVVASAAALAACGGSDASSTSQSGDGSGGSASSSKSNEQDAALVKLTRCLREQGVDVPETGGHGAFAQLSPADREKLRVAIEGPCREYQTESFGDATDPQSEEFTDALTAFTACMRKQGVDVADPVPNAPEGPFAVLHTLDQSDPKVAAAAAACQDKLPVGPGGP